ncbi:MAG: UvrB/UvrC motif-containing protein [Clostridia bacterium]|nr:UvrB/UvrC motif-containing protein [Clostridia bacterium]
MNCEKCKNKKATLFYADEGGGRHALCASCGALQGKLGNLRSAEESGEEKGGYLPELTLSSLLTAEEQESIFIIPEDPALICSNCKTAAANLAHSGRVGCPECYGVFEAFLFSDPKRDGQLPMARMPRSRRRYMERRAAISELREQIAGAVAKENYELAATLRDKIKTLENE